MFEGVRQVIGNALNNVFEEGKWPLDSCGHHGSLYRFFNPIQYKIYDETHELASKRLELLKSNREEDKEALANIEARLDELRSQRDEGGLAIKEFKRQLRKEVEEDDSPREGEGSYARFRREQKRAEEDRRGGSIETR